MTETRVRISKTKEAVPKTGSYKVTVERWFYYEDDRSRRIRPGTMTSEEALEAARAFARSVNPTSD